MTHNTPAMPVSEMPLRDLVSNYLALKRQARNGNSTAAEHAAVFRREIRRREIDNFTQPVGADKGTLAPA